MSPLLVNYLNAFVLIAAGIYGYFFMPLGADEHRSATALIPAFAGVLFLVFGLVWKARPKFSAHAASVLALVLLVMCIIRFMKIEDWNNKKYIFLICILSNLLALTVFVRSFIVARVIKKA